MARIAILAQDLIWSDRLARAVEAAGAAPVRAQTAPEFDRALEDADFAIVDLTASAYDPLTRSSGRARPARACSPSDSTTTSTFVSAHWPVARSGCSPTERCSRTDPR